MHYETKEAQNDAPRGTKDKNQQGDEARRLSRTEQTRTVKMQSKTASSGWRSRGRCRWKSTGRFDLVSFCEEKWKWGGWWVPFRPRSATCPEPSHRIHQSNPNLTSMDSESEILVKLVLHSFLTHLCNNESLFVSLDYRGRKRRGKSH